MKKLIAALMITLSSMALMADMISEKAQTEKVKKKIVHTFASRSCRGISYNSENRCMANYCTQADAVEVYLIISKNDYRNAVACFKRVFEPCASSCSADSAENISRKCNTLLNQCIRKL